MNSSRATFAAFAALSITCLVVGCATTAELHAVVEQRAAYDLQCSPDALEVTDLPGVAYGVRGCGKQATYLLTGLSCQNTTQLTKREVQRHCTPVLDHSVEAADKAGPPREQDVQ